jgi:hypothetical protein
MQGSGLALRRPVALLPLGRGKTAGFEVFSVGDDPM